LLPVDGLARTWVDVVNLYMLHAIQSVRAHVALLLTIP